MKKLSIRSKLILFFLIVGLSPILLNSAINLNQAQTALKESTLSKLRTIVEKKRAQIIDILDHIAHNTRNLSQRPDIIRYLSADIGEKETQPLAMVSSIQFFALSAGFEDVFLFRADGTPAMRVSRNASTTAITENSIADFKAGITPALEAALRGKSDLFDFQSFSGTPSRVLGFSSTPIMQGHRIIGALVLAFTPEWIDHIMTRRIGLGENGEAYIVGSDFLMRSDSHFEKKPTVLSTRVKSKGIAAALQGKVGCDTYADFRNVSVWGCYDHISYRQIRWTVLGEVDEAKIEVPFRNLERGVFLTSIITAICVVAIGVLFSMRLSEPLKAITHAARMISSGHIHEVPKVKGGDEIAQLSAAFSAMTESLRAKAAYAQQISNGNLALLPPVFDGEDILGRAMVKMHRRIRALVQNLEDQVASRTIELEKKNASLISEMESKDRLHRTLQEKRQKLSLLTQELVRAEEQERRRLAMALHDGQSQELAYIRLKLGILLENPHYFSNEDEAHAFIANLYDVTSSCIQTARTLTVELSPPILYECGLAAALEWLTRSISERYKLRIETDISKYLQDVPVFSAVFLFQVARELLINVSKHAKASTAGLSLHGENNDIVLCIKDDGVGIPQHLNITDTACGFGLFSIRERVRTFDGTLKISSSPGHGLTVVVNLPIKQAHAMS